MHPTVARVVSALEAAGRQGEVWELSDSARTAAEAAPALGCDVGAISTFDELVRLSRGTPARVSA